MAFPRSPSARDGEEEGPEAASPSAHPPTTPTAEEWEPFDAAGFDRLLRAEDGHFWFRARNEVIDALVRPVFARLPDGFRAVEFGCGTGNVTRVLVGATDSRGTVVASEVRPEGVPIAERRAGCRVLQGDLEHPPEAPPFDAVCLFDVVEHIEDDEAAMRAAARLLTPHGRLVLTVPAHQGLWSDYDVASGHHRRYSEETMRRLLRGAGFHIEYMTPFMSLLLPPMWLSRRLRGHGESRSHDATLDSEFRVVPVANGIAYELLRREASFVRARRRLPFGTSLAIVAAPAGRSV